MGGGGEGRGGKGGPRPRREQAPRQCAPGAGRWALPPGRAGGRAGGVREPAPAAGLRGDERPLAGAARGRTRRAGPASACATAEQPRADPAAHRQVGPCVPLVAGPGRAGGLCARVPTAVQRVRPPGSGPDTVQQAGSRLTATSRRPSAPNFWSLVSPGFLVCGSPDAADLGREEATCAGAGLLLFCNCHLN